MKAIFFVLFLLGNSHFFKAASQSLDHIFFTPLPYNEVTTSIKTKAETRIFEINRTMSKITATAYLNMDCGKYSATAETKVDTIYITINNSTICDGNNKYYKLEAVINDFDNHFKQIKINEAFTFLKEGETIKPFTDYYLVGDLDNDDVPDTATVSYEKVILPDGTVDNDCGRGTCYMTATFKNNIPPLTISQCYGMSIEALADLNNDGIDEIVMATHYFVGNWHNILIWSYDGFKWELLCEARTFDDEESDATRIKKGRGENYYLHYKTWNKDNSDIVPSKKKFKTRNNKH